MNATRSRGFTLIEMVVAFAILALTLTTLYGAFANALARSRHDLELSEGTLLAESLLARAGSECPLTEETRSGAWHAYAYELTARPVPPEPGARPPTLPTVRVTAAVTWSDGAGARQIALSTLKFLPAVSP
jgi:general secretion pathway protein I